VRKKVNREEKIVLHYNTADSEGTGAHDIGE